MQKLEELYPGPAKILKNAWARRATSADPARAGKTLTVNPMEDTNPMLYVDDKQRRIDDALRQTQFVRPQLTESGESMYHGRRLKDLGAYKKSSGSLSMELTESLGSLSLWT